MPKPYIIIFGNPFEDAVNIALAAIRGKEGFENAEVVSIDQPTLTGVEPGTNVYFLDHGNSFEFGDFRNPGALAATPAGSSSGKTLRDHLSGAGKIVLMSCSTGGTPVQDNTFAQRNFAQGLSRQMSNTPVDAAVGPVRASTLEVRYDHNMYTVGTTNGWFRYEPSGGVKQGEPFKFEAPGL